MMTLRNCQHNDLLDLSTTPLFAKKRPLNQMGSMDAKQVGDLCDTPTTAGPSCSSVSSSESIGIAVPLVGPTKRPTCITAESRDTSGRSVSPLTTSWQRHQSLPTNNKDSSPQGMGAIGVSRSFDLLWENDDSVGDDILEFQKEEESEFEEVTVEEDDDDFDDATIESEVFCSPNQQRWLIEARSMGAIPGFDDDDDDDSLYLAGRGDGVLQLPLIHKKLFRALDMDDDACSETMSTTHASDASGVYTDASGLYTEVSVFTNADEAPIIISQPHDRPQSDLGAALRKGLEALHKKHQKRYPEEASKTTTPTNSISISPSSTWEEVEPLPQAAVVKGGLPTEARKETFPVVSLTFLANPLSAATVTRVMNESWSILAPGGALHVCHVIQRREILEDEDDALSLSQLQKTTVTSLEPHIPEHMKACVRQVDSCEEQRKYELETLEILRQQGSAVMFDPQRDLIQRWTGVKPLEE